MKRTLDPLAYWTMTENTGAFGDLSGNGFTATPTAGLTYQNLTLPDGSRIPLFDGSKEATFWTTAFRDAFNGNSGSLIALCRVADTEWEDGTARTLINMRGNNDIITVAKSTNNYAVTASRIASGVTRQGYFYPSGKNDVMMLVLTWDRTADRFKLYADGLLSATLSAEQWTEQIATAYTRIGRSSSVASDYWLGNLGHVGITDKVLSASEVQALFREFYPTTQDIFIIGDSKSAGAVGAWRAILLQSLETEESVRYILNPTGFNIGGYDAGEMADYIETNLTSSTATPSHILINLGANDVPEPTPEADFKSQYKRIIDRCKSVFPDVPIYLATILRNDELVTPEKLALINGYIADLVTSENVNAGMSEAGLTLPDGIHYGSAAFATVASRWMTALGYVA